MGQRVDETADLSQGNDDDRLGEAVEQYLALVEQGEAPPADVFASRFPDIAEDVQAALEGLELVNGLVGAAGSQSGYHSGPGRNIESGRRIAGYRVVRELGRGGMGTVYEAVHVGLDRPVALKVLGTHAAPDSSARRRFLNEARTAAGLHHTHIVPVFDVGQVGGLCYYAMQRIQGSGLDRVIRHRRRVREALGFGRRLDLSDGGSPGHSDSASASHGSRLNRMWVRVSESLPWGRPGPRLLPRPAPQGDPRKSSAASASAAALAQDPSRCEGLTDSTASWIRGGLSATFNGGGLLARPSSRSSLASTRGDEDASPPFDPPRGGAYHRWAAEVGLQAAEALAHAHHQGIIHRDVKPSNLLIDGQGTIWVADFGLARRLADPGLTHHDGLIGTPRYMSPEQGRTGVIDGRTDVYSLGATLYELLTLRPPFDGATASELLDQIASREPIPPRQIDRRIPRDLETIVLKALAKRPADRYESAAAFAEDLARFLNREPVKARRISPIGRMWRVARRHPGITSVSTVATVLVLSIASYAFYKVREQRDQARMAKGMIEEEQLRTKAAVRETQAAMRTELWRHAALVRRTSEPDRRARGLDLLRKAAALNPEPSLKAQIRDEAGEFLILREIGPRVDLPTGSIRDLVYDSDNARLAVLSQDGEELTIWDARERRRIDRIGLTHNPRPTTASTSEGASLAIGSRREGSGATEANPLEVGPPAPSTPTAFRGGPGRGAGGWRRPSDQLVQAGAGFAVVLPGGGAATLLNASGTTVRELTRPGRRVLSVFGDPSGKRLVSIDVENDAMGMDFRFSPSFDAPPFGRLEFQVVLWNLERSDSSPTVLDRIHPEPRAMNSFPLVALLPDGKGVAVGARGSATVKIFSTDGRALKPVESQAEVSALAAGAGGRLATVSGATIQLWDVETGEFLSSFSSAQSFVTKLEFNPRGTLLATSGMGPQVELWDTLSHKPVALLPITEQVVDLAFSADGESLVVGGRDTLTSFWRIGEPASRTQLTGIDSRTVSLAFRNDGLLAIGDVAGETWLWCDSRSPGRPNAPTLVRGASARTDHPEGSHEPEPESSAPRGRDRDRQRDRATTLAFDAKGMLVAHDARGLKIWPAHPKSPCEPTRLDLPRLSEGGRFWASPTARTGDGKALAIVHGSSILIWRSEAPGRTLPVVRTDEPPVDAYIAAMGPTRGGPPRFGGPSRYVGAQLSSSMDRLYVLSPTNRERPTSNVQVWKLQPASAESIEAELLPWNGSPPLNITSMALRPDGRLLALGERTGGVVLVDTERLTTIARLQPETVEEAEAEGFLSTLAFSTDGRRLAAGGIRGSIHVWSSTSSTRYEYLARLPSQCGPISSIAFDAAGKRLAVGGSEPLVEVWDVDLFLDELKRLELAD